MAAPLGMETYAARLASYDATHPTTKKRVSTTKGPKSLKWPHKNPSAAQLAKAGFYYAPTSSCPDSTTCFSCEKCLDGWEEGDDPIKEHLNYSSTCGWAVNIAIEQAIENGTFEEIDPMASEMLEARRSTFNGRWPHETKRGWTCKTPKMIEAGWYYCPTPESDDFVKCPYCSLSLDGWEPKDKPYEEHQRRSPECAFFMLTQSVGTKPVKGRRGRPSKAGRVSMQSKFINVAEDQSIMDRATEEGDSLNTVATNMTTALNVVKAVKKGGKGKKGKGKAQPRSVKAVMGEQLQGSSFIEPEDDDFEVKVVPSPLPKCGKKRTSNEMDVDEGDVPGNLDLKPAKRRATTTRANNLQPQSLPEPSILEDAQDVHMSDNEETARPELPVSKKGAKKGRKRASSTTRKASTLSTASKASLRGIPADKDIDAALEVDLDRPLTDNDQEAENVVPVHPKTRRLTRTRPGARKVTASVAPVRSRTRISATPVEVVQIDVKIDIVHSPAKSVDDGTVEAERQDRCTVSAEVQPVSAKAKSRKGKAIKKVSTAPQLVVDDDSNANNTAVAMDLEPAASMPLEVAADADDEADDLIVNRTSASQTSSKVVKAREPSRQLPGRGRKASAVPISQPATNLTVDLESSILTSKSADDDSGNETDASSTSQATSKRGGRKASVAKKGRKPRKVAGPSRNIEDIVQAPRQEPVEDNDKSSVMYTTEDASLPVPPIYNMDAPLETKQEPAKEAKLEKEVVKPSKPKGTRGRPKSKATGRGLLNPEHDMQSNQEATTLQQSAGPITDSKPLSPSPRNSTMFHPPQHAVPSPTPSPQSSDAENQPPSSRPSQQRPPLFDTSPSRSQAIRVPLAASTPNTSPSRGNGAGKMQTTFAWKGVDLENIFLGTPKPGKENTSTLDSMKNSLSNPEKKMTVEEWIKYNAAQGEEKLRNECERLVGRFEGEGNRALKALEGIICEE